VRSKAARRAADELVTIVLGLSDVGLPQVINLRTIRPLDMATVIESVKKTGRVVTVESGWAHFGVGAEIAASLLECMCIPQSAPFHTPFATLRLPKHLWKWMLTGFARENGALHVFPILPFAAEAFDYLDAPPYRVASVDAPLPYAKTLEAECQPQNHSIVASVKAVLYRK
jgi:pyruvate dehydrogenase E1 component beta subunit